MAQSTAITVPSSLGNLDKLKIAVVTLTNTASEATFNLTPAMAGMSGFIVVIPCDEVAAAGVRAVATRVNGIALTYALTFTAGDEIQLLCIGV